MRKRFSWLSATALIAFVIWASSDTFAARPHQDCSNPSVFEGADVNIVVLPWVSTGNARSSLDQLGQRLALLVKLDAFSHVLDYGSVGATQMEVPPGADPETCIPQVVIPKLLGEVPGASTVTAKGKGLLIVWGVMYEEGEDIVVQTYARFLRPGTSESIRFQISKFQFSAQPSAQVVAFAPRSLKESLLAEIEASYQRADIVHKEPRDDSEGEPLPRPVAKCISCRGELTPGYQVEERNGEWIHVRWIDPESHHQRSGWIHAATSFAGNSLDQTLPELHFIQGCVGYLMQRVVSDRREQMSKTLAAEAVDEFETFVKLNGSADKTTNAVALELAGMIQLLQGNDVVAAQKNFEAALVMVPYDTDAITLASLTQIGMEWKLKNVIPKPLIMAERLTNAVAVSATPNYSLDNLRSYLQLLLSLPESTQLEGLPRTAIRQRLQALERVRLSAS